jgi:hypothetical protein
MDCFEERRGRRYSMREFSLDDLQGDDEGEEKRNCPFSLKRRETLSGRFDSERTDHATTANSRESLGVYGAIMQVNWDHD